MIERSKQVRRVACRHQDRCQTCRSDRQSYVADAFADDGIERVALEEIAFDDEHDSWLITIGFSRPWDRDGFDPAAHGDGGWQMRYQALLDLQKRTYKIVVVSANDGVVTRVENRPV